MSRVRLFPFPAILLALALGQGPAPLAAQDAADPLDILALVEGTCQAQPDSLACSAAAQRAEAAMALVIAEAGNTRDRGTFLPLVRQVLADPSPDIRASAAFALAKLSPDADDTPAIRALLVDPVSHVRAGGWAAAVRASDPGLRLLAQRVPDLPVGWSWEADGQPYDPAALGVALPPGAEFLWLTAELRQKGQVQFLTEAPVDEVAAFLALQARTGPVPLAALLDSDPALAALGLGFLAAQVYGDPQALVLPPLGDRPLVLAVIYRDLAFGQTGFSLVFAGPVALTPPVAAAEDPVNPAPTLPVATAFKPGAPEEESTLFMAVLAAHGVGAEAYLQLFPEGAYADEARALLDAPRLLLDGGSIPDTGVIEVRFANVPADASASLRLLALGDGDWEPVDSAFTARVATEPAVFDLQARHPPGIYLLEAEVRLPDRDETLYLLRDLSIVAVPAVLALEETEVAPGAALAVRYSGMAGGSRDYVSVAPAGSPPDRYLSYVYTEGAREGVAALTAPDQPGAYELRAFFRDDTKTIRASLPFTVTGSAPVDTPDPQAPKPETPDPQVIVAPPADTGSAALVLDSAVVAPGAPLGFAWSGLSGAAKDYISTAMAGSAPESYLKYLYTEGAVAGRGTLEAPQREGTYELRAFFASDAGTVQAMLPFTVRASITLTLPKTAFAPGEAITVAYSGMSGASQDYVSTAPAGSGPSEYLTYAYTQGARDGTLTLAAPDRPGDYELRAVLQSDPGTVKAVLLFTVSAPP